jgi:hypothetical protein
MGTPRYTRNVGNWPARLVSVVLSVMLGGGSAVASICEALCVDEPSATSSGIEGGGSARHHHSGANSTGVSATERHSGHHHASLPGPTAELSAAADVPVSCASDCWRLLARARTSFAADRAYSGLVPPLATTASTPALPENSGRQSSRLSRGSPPGVASTRTRLVLRI